MRTVSELVVRKLSISHGTGFHASLFAFADTTDRGTKGRKRGGALFSFIRYFLRSSPSRATLSISPFPSPSTLERWLRVSNEGEEEEAEISLWSWRFNRAQWQRIPLRYCHRCRWQTNPSRWGRKLSYSIERTGKHALYTSDDATSRLLPFGPPCETSNSLITRTRYTPISRSYVIIRTSFIPLIE